MTTYRTVGIDLAIRGDHVARIFENGRPVGKPIRFRLTSASLGVFISTIMRDLPSGAKITAIMEPTGMSWFPVACWLRRAGVTVIRVKGQRVKALRRYLSEHAKTDAADADVLAAIPSFGGLALDPVYVPCAERHALQRLTKQRERLESELCAIKRRLIDLVRWACPALEASLPDFRTSLALAILREFLDPKAILRTRRDRLVRFLGSNASGNHPHSGPFVEELADALKRSAHETLALHADAVDFALLQVEVALEIDRLRLIETQIKELTGRIEAIYMSLHPTDALRSLPGIGATLAPSILGLLHEPGRFRSERHMRGFCGLFPTVHASGGADRPGQRITQAGNDRMKKALFLAADSARRVDPDLAAVYHRMMMFRGHHHKQALCAVAGRLVNRIHKVLRTGETYQLRDTTGQPISIAQARAIIAENYSIPPNLRRARRRNPPPLRTAVEASCEVPAV